MAEAKEKEWEWEGVRRAEFDLGWLECVASIPAELVNKQLEYTIRALERGQAENKDLMVVEMPGRGEIIHSDCIKEEKME